MDEITFSNSRSWAASLISALSETPQGAAPYNYGHGYEL